MSSSNLNSSTTIDHTGLYFIASSDNPNSVLVTFVFNGVGFNSWKRSMMISLAAKNKIGFIDALITKPSYSDPSFSNWFRVNSMVISWILNSPHKNIADSVLFLQTASEILIELNHRYALSDGALLYQIQKQLYLISQGSEDFSDLFHQIK